MSEEFNLDAHDHVSRKFKRRDANQIPVEIECKGETFEGTLEDISQSGLRLKCNSDLPERGTIKIRIPQGEANDDSELLLKGILRWTEQTTEAGVELTGKVRTF
jgi:hypothetical protein